MSNNQNIIQRIEDIRKELGMSNSGSPQSGSIRDLTQQILNKLISTSTGDINGKIIDLYDKMNNVYNDLASTSTSYTKGKIADLYTKFNNIYNELNSTSTSYMKGKINSMYNNYSNNTSILSSIYNETTNSSTSYMNGQMQWLYNNFNGIIKSSQFGKIYYSKETIVGHAPVNIRKSFVILNAYASPISSGIGDAVKYSGMALSNRSTSQMTFNVPWGAENNMIFSWQLVEFY